MNLKEHWPEIQRVLRRGQASSIYCSFATINADGTPNVTPVGTVFLRDDCTGYYFDHYAATLAANLDANPSACVMAVSSGRLFWFWSFLKGRFASPPGVRLYGVASAKSQATKEELAAIEARVRPTKWLKGSCLLWTDFRYVRGIQFHAFRPVTYPVMVQGLWGQG
ncbi:MAG: pyridoxamine 5'-phosphate oxidase family protein [Burkholderiaceae bacterium]